MRKKRIFFMKSLYFLKYICYICIVKTKGNSCFGLLSNPTFLKNYNYGRIGSEIQ